MRPQMTRLCESRVALFALVVSFLFMNSLHVGSQVTALTEGGFALLALEVSPLLVDSYLVNCQCLEVAEARVTSVTAVVFPLFMNYSNVALQLPLKVECFSTLVTFAVLAPVSIPYVAFQIPLSAKSRLT